LAAWLASLAATATANTSQAVGAFCRISGCFEKLTFSRISGHHPERRTEVEASSEIQLAVLVRRQLCAKLLQRVLEPMGRMALMSRYSIEHG
jgi:hypothetical protein